MRQTERAILDALVQGEHPALSTLRAQLMRAEVSSREYTGVGAFIGLTLPEAVPVLPVGRWVISDVLLTHPQLANDAGAALFIEDGKASMLELFSYDEPWPDSQEGFRAVYLARGWRPPDKGGELLRSDERDLDWLSESFEEARRSAGAA